MDYLRSVFKELFLCTHAPGLIGVVAAGTLFLYPFRYVLNSTNSSVIIKSTTLTFYVGSILNRIFRRQQNLHLFESKVSI